MVDGEASAALHHLTIATFAFGTMARLIGTFQGEFRHPAVRLACGNPVWAAASSTAQDMGRHGLCPSAAPRKCRTVSMNFPTEIGFDR